MKIEFDEKTKEMLIYRRVKNVTLYGKLPVGCWGTPKIQVYVRLREPKDDTSRYDQYEVEGIKVYVEKTLEFEDVIKIHPAKYTSDFPDAEFIVEGQL